MCQVLLVSIAFGDIVPSAWATSLSPTSLVCKLLQNTDQTCEVFPYYPLVDLGKLSTSFAHHHYGVHRTTLNCHFCLPPDASPQCQGPWLFYLFIYNPAHSLAFMFVEQILPPAKTASNKDQWDKTDLNKQTFNREFPAGLVVKTLCFHCQKPEFNPWSGN